jgi:hypothetical protein
MVDIFIVNGIMMDYEPTYNGGHHLVSTSCIQLFITLGLVPWSNHKKSCPYRG